MILYIVLGGIVVSLILQIIAFKRAPFGWEDKNGFHKGEEK
jgi:hypothetical protein